MTTIRVVDLETCGTDPSKHGIVEIASVDLESGGQFLKPLSYLVNPGQKIPPEAQAVHHISDAMVSREPQIDEVIPKVMTCYPFPTLDAFAAHNAAFEQGWLKKYSGQVRWICTWKSAMRAWPEAPGFGNQVLRYYLNINVPDKLAHPVHRALHDAVVTGYILQKLLQATTVANLIRYTQEPPLLPKCPIGKEWRGKLWSDVDSGFLQWMTRQEDMDEDLKWNARHELERRERPQEPEKVQVMIPGSDQAIQHDQEGHDLALEYVKWAKIAALPLMKEPGDLRAWWDDPVCLDHRNKYGVVKGHPAYDDLVQACVTRKAELTASQKSLVTA